MNTTPMASAVPLSRAKGMTRRLVPRPMRNWLRSPATSARWIYDGIKFSCGVRQQVEIRPGWTISCHPAAYRCAYFAQQNDPEQVAEFDAFISNAAEGMVLFDVGAHFGLFSLAALHFGGPTARAIAIDPSPVAVHFIKLQAALNHCDDRLQVFEAAVHDHPGHHSLVPVGVVASGYYVAPDAEHPESELITANAITLDALAQAAAAIPTHIKIDVEGYEAAVLRGGRQLLASESAPILFLEVHNDIVRNLGGEPAETLRLLKAYGFQTFSVEGSPLSHEQILMQGLTRIIARKTPISVPANS